MDIKNAFPAVLSALQASADQLDHEDKEKAQQSIVDITDEIVFLSSISQELEAEYKAQQAKIAQDLADTIKWEGEVYDATQKNKALIQSLKADVESVQMDRDSIVKKINSRQIELAKAQMELQMHQARLNELNDASVGSIFRSIFCLGLDRAAMGIATLINNDAGRISALNDELSAYRKALNNDYEGYSSDMNKLEALEKSLAETARKADELTDQEKFFHEQEVVSRRKLQFFTQVALFYGRLELLLVQVHEKIENVSDIVAELNNDERTIIDIDSSEEDYISLKQALEKFDDFLQTEPVVTSPKYQTILQPIESGS